MNFWAALESDLHEKPLFPVEPKNRDLTDERVHQAQFRKDLAWCAPSIESWGVPNAGKRGPKAIAQAHLEGLSSGVHDEHYIWDHDICFLEWKRGDGDLTQNQIDWGNRQVRRGFRVACVRTPEFALALFAEWGAPVRVVEGSR